MSRAIPIIIIIIISVCRIEIVIPINPLLYGVIEKGVSD